MRKSGCLPKNVGFFLEFAVTVNATNNVSYSKAYVFIKPNLFELSQC